MSARSQRGGALLAVLWISAVLSAIAFSVAHTVRTETERTSTLVDGVKTYYLASSGVERAWLYCQWGQKYFQPNTPRLILQFPTGTATVEIIPESSKLSINTAPPEDLFRLIAALGVDPDRARQIALGIVDWRAAVSGNVSMFDGFYGSLTPSFRARHASFQEIEELLLVRGMTPDLFYGTLVRDAQDRLIPQAGLKDCLSVYGSDGAIDVNHVAPAVMTAIGVPADAVAAIVARRAGSPFRSQVEIAPIQQFSGAAGQRLGVGGNTIFTFRSTGQLRLPDGRFSDMKRTVSAMLKFHQRQVNAPPIEVLRWYDY